VDEQGSTQGAGVIAECGDQKGKRVRKKEGKIFFGLQSTERVEKVISFTKG